jgi:hypothetical protein
MHNKFVQIYFMRSALFVLLVLLFSCDQSGNTNSSLITSQTTDTLPADSADSYEYDCYDSFMAAAEKISDSAGLQVEVNGQDPVSFDSLVKGDFLYGHTNAGFRDLDGDGKKELLIFTYTGGMHCCDEIYILEEAKQGHYIQKAKFFAGNTCVNLKNEFSYNVYEMLGYFLSCYACLYEDSAKGLVAPPPVVYHYQKGQLVLAGDTNRVREAVFKNLNLLKDVPMNTMTEEWDDSGVRKMYALNFATMHLLYRCDLQQTKLLFEQYYTFKDKTPVWKELKQHLQALEEQTTFTP